MKMIMSVAVCLLFLPLLIFAQKPPVKFGKIDDSDVKMTSHPLDSSANAIVLEDYGSTIFRYTDEEGFIFQFDRIIRIKVLKKAGQDFGDFEIPFYHNSTSKEKVTSIKGYTYNLEKGSVVKEKLEKTSIFEEETNDNWSKMKVSMPNVKVGSVIELAYTLASPFIWNLTTWEFQSSIPTVHSEYRVSIPEYFDYQLLHYGYLPLALSDESISQGYAKYHIDKGIPKGLVYSSESTKLTPESEQIEFKLNNKRWVATNVPAFDLEPYVASPNDYLSKIKFELRGTLYPNSAYKAYMGTWESLNTSFMDNTSFGEVIKHTGYMKNELEQISTLKSDEEKIASLVNLIRSQVEWNEMFSVYATSTLRSAWTDKKGNTADINLMIVAGLKKLGFDSDPVLISTRGHGMIREPYAISNQFNSVIAMAKLNGKNILLDGTDRYLPIGVLPKKCLNEKGWKVSEASPGWVQIMPASKQESVFQANFDIGSDGQISGSIDLAEKGYDGYAANKKYKLSGEEKYFEDIQNKNNDWVIDEYEYEKGSNFNDPFKSKYQVEFNNKAIASAEVLYFNPTLDQVLDKNPFKIEHREYPVDFAYPSKSLFMFKYNIPEGYSVDELPKSTAFALPNNDAMFTYNISSIGNTIQVMADLRINKTLFAQTEYPSLKQFYDLVVQKCAEQVVLKKTDH